MTSAFVVDDLDAALERARDHGVEPAGEVFARGDGVQRTFVTDPDGHVIELMQSACPGDRRSRVARLAVARGSRNARAGLESRNMSGAWPSVRDGRRSGSGGA